MGQRHEVRHIRCVTVYDANSSPLSGLNLVNLILGQAVVPNYCTSQTEDD